ncbi:hypothetical protein ACRYCC_42145 [Actinomadura scrupuli]|uniref:hypothetical protein n=1 Tax=Actinomadura scrupuli TaxID=559629 RepID=UPI003D98B3F7
MKGSPIELELNRLAESGATGALHVGAEGSLFLTDGMVTFAQSERATSLDLLLTASGRVSEQSWQRARARGAPPATWKAATAKRLSHAEFETFVLLAIFDAAFFLLPSSEPAGFAEAERHWLDPIWRITPGTLAHECRRRQAQLEAAWPYALADDAPVIPIRRLRRQRVILTGLQAELLLNADGHRTVTDLARELGRTCFGSLLALRGLAAASLVHVESTTPRRRRPALAPPPVNPPAEAPGQPRWAAVEQDLLVRLRDALTEFT